MSTVKLTKAQERLLRRAASMFHPDHAAVPARTLEILTALGLVELKRVRYGPHYPCVYATAAGRAWLAANPESSEGGGQP